MPRCLELFCGTSSISRECSNRGWEVITVDCLKKFNPTICCDIMELDYESLGAFDYLHAGIPCTSYSIASCKRNPEVGNKLAIRTLEIISHLLIKNPNMLWSIENPFSSLLKEQPFMQGLPYNQWHTKWIQLSQVEVLGLFCNLLGFVCVFCGYCYERFAQMFS